MLRQVSDQKGLFSWIAYSILTNIGPLKFLGLHVKFKIFSTRKDNGENMSNFQARFVAASL